MPGAWRRQQPSSPQPPRTITSAALAPLSSATRGPSLALACPAGTHLAPWLHPFPQNGVSGPRVTSCPLGCHPRHHHNRRPNGASTGHSQQLHRAQGRRLGRHAPGPAQRLHPRPGSPGARQGAGRMRRQAAAGRRAAAAAPPPPLIRLWILHHPRLRAPIHAARLHHHRCTCRGHGASLHTQAPGCRSFWCHRGSSCCLPRPAGPAPSAINELATALAPNSCLPGLQMT